MHSIARRLFLLSGGLVLTACGGGGASLGPPGATSVSITATNGQDVASGVAQAFSAAGSLADFNLDFSINEVSALAAPGGASARIAHGGQRPRSLGLLMHRAAPGPNLATTDQCLVAGSVTVTSNILNAGTLTADDTVSASFTKCDDGNGQVINGAISIAVQSFTGDLQTGFFTLAVSANFDQLGVTAGTDVALFDGDATVALDTTSNTLLDATVSGSSLSVTVNGSKTTLASYVVSTETDISNSNDYDESLTASGTLTSDALGGKVDLQTVDPLQQKDSEQFPRSGQFSIFGAGNSSEDVTVTTGGAVTLDIDADGNGTFETTQNTTWTALFN